MQGLARDIAYRPIAEAAVMEQAVAYSRDAQSPVLETFLRVMRQTLKNGQKKTRVRRKRQGRDH
jgi:hypothetical protein